MLIDTGTSDMPRVKSDFVDDTQRIRFTSVIRAERAKRQAIEAIQSIEHPALVAEYVAAESVLIDALHIFDPAMADEIEQAAKEHEAMLRHGLESLLRSSARGGTAQPAQDASQGQDGKDQGDYW